MTRLRKPYLDDGDVTVYAGDCIEVMRELPEALVDAVVTDPPYGINFMGKAWDGKAIADAAVSGVDHTKTRERSGSMIAGEYDLSSRGMHAFQAFSEAWAREAYRVLKPGGHLLAFAGTRTYHRMASGVEDAGFEIRDCIAWMYGSGFPKSLDVSKAIDKAAGTEREVIGTNPNVERAARIVARTGGGEIAFGCGSLNASITAPATKAAREWSGWGTALKPAFEPVVIARKPLVGTVAQNVLEHGTGALNIDACRIDMGDEYDPDKVQRQQRSDGAVKFASAGLIGSEIPTYKPGGRWPANVALDETAATILDEQSGTLHARGNVKSETRRPSAGTWPTWNADVTAAGNPSDSGGASRFFYTAKASRQDRNVGGLADNTHPTVKPTDLMRWLIRLVTPPGGIILDPFGGSGSTGLAARAENVRCILIEREDEYLKIIGDRLAQLSLLA